MNNDSAFLSLFGDQDVDVNNFGQGAAASGNADELDFSWLQGPSASAAVGKDGASEVSAEPFSNFASTREMNNRRHSMCSTGSVGVMSKRTKIRPVSPVDDSVFANPPADRHWQFIDHTPEFYQTHRASAEQEPVEWEEEESEEGMTMEELYNGFPECVKQDVILDNGRLTFRRRSIDTSNLFACPQVGCGKFFNRLYNLKSHLRTHTNDKPFICGHCGLGFARNHDLKRHELSHLGIRSFKCSACGKCFTRSDALRRHEMAQSCKRRLR